MNYSSFSSLDTGVAEWGERGGEPFGYASGPTSLPDAIDLFRPHPGSLPLLLSLRCMLFFTGTVICYFDGQIEFPVSFLVKGAMIEPTDCS